MMLGHMSDQSRFFRTSKKASRGDWCPALGCDSWQIIMAPLACPDAARGELLDAHRHTGGESEYALEYRT
jgi:hypothetical protein